MFQIDEIQRATSNMDILYQKTEELVLNAMKIIEEMEWIEQLMEENQNV